MGSVIKSDKPNFLVGKQIFEDNDLNIIDKWVACCILYLDSKDAENQGFKVDHVSELSGLSYVTIMRSLNVLKNKNLISDQDP